MAQGLIQEADEEDTPTLALKKKANQPMPKGIQWKNRNPNNRNIAVAYSQTYNQDKIAKFIS